MSQASQHSTVTGNSEKTRKTEFSPRFVFLPQICLPSSFPAGANGFVTLSGADFPAVNFSIYHDNNNIFPKTENEKISLFYSSDLLCLIERIIPCF